MSSPQLRISQQGGMVILVALLVSSLAAGLLLAQYAAVRSWQQTSQAMRQHLQLAAIAQAAMRHVYRHAGISEVRDACVVPVHPPDYFMHQSLSWWQAQHRCEWQLHDHYVTHRVEWLRRDACLWLRLPNGQHHRGAGLQRITVYVAASKQASLVVQAVYWRALPVRATCPVNQAHSARLYASGLQSWRSQ